MKQNRLGSMVVGTVLALVFAGASAVHSGTFTVFGPKHITAGQVLPTSDLSNFDVDLHDTTYLLRVWNGGNEGQFSRVDLGSIKLNGQEVVGVLGLNLLSGSTEHPVTLAEQNSLLVESGKVATLPGDPPGGLTVEIVGVDNDSPVIIIESPAPDALFSSSSVRVTGRATDALSGVASVTCNETPAALDGTSFRCEVTLEEGRQPILVAATDPAGNAAQASVIVTVDLTPPSLAITSPAPSALFAASPIRVDGTVSDLTATGVQVNNVPATVNGESFSVTIPLQEGTNLVTATGTDAVGRVGTASLSVGLDTTPPRLTIESPPSGSTVYAPIVTLSGTVNDTVVGSVNAADASVVCSGVEAAVANRTFSASGVTLQPGSNTLTCTATDRAGNTRSASHDLLYDNSAQKRINAVSGDGQSAEIGQTLLAPLMASLTDEAGAPVAGQKVIFRVVENDGLVDGQRAAVVVTDALGQARVIFTLGSRAGVGNNRVRATAVGFAGEAVFNASSTLGAAAGIVVDAGTNQTGVVGRPLPRPFFAVVIDAGKNRRAGVPVTFTVAQGGGSFGGNPSVTVTTDSDGKAGAVLTLGPGEGFDNNVVEADFPGNSSGVASFAASGMEPGDPAKTRITGVVLDNSDVPIPGVTIRIETLNSATDLSTETDERGQFYLPAPVGHLRLIADGRTATRPGSWPILEFELVTVPGRDNTIGMPIYLLPLSAQSLFVDEVTGGTLTHDELPGFSLTVAPGSARFPGGSRSGTVAVTSVHPDRVPMTPGFGQQPRFIITIQPPNVTFDPPAAISMPNADALAPGRKTEMYSFDHDLGQFVSIGTATASEDGSVIRSDPGGGIIKGGWHCGGDPSGSGRGAGCKSTGTCEACGTPEECYDCHNQGTCTECGECWAPSTSGSKNCIPDDTQTPTQIKGNCRVEKCKGGNVTSDFEDVDNSDAKPGSACCGGYLISLKDSCCDKKGQIQAKKPAGFLLDNCEKPVPDQGWQFEYDGCSLPVSPGFDKDNPTGEADTQFGLRGDLDGPCDRHDRCYQTCNHDLAARFKCDLAMFRDMVAVCKASGAGGAAVDKCLVWANVYFDGLRTAGGEYAFQDRQSEVCICCE